MASLTPNQTSDRPRFDRGARLHLVLMLLWLGLGIGTFIYIFTLPTDGWQVSTPDDVNGVGYIYQKNVMGAASGLQPGDRVIAVEGIYLEGGNDNLLHVSDRWRSGNTLLYTVLRGGQEMQIVVPLVQWNAWSFLTQAAKISDLTTILSLAILWAMGSLAFWRKPDNPAAALCGYCLRSGFPLGSRCHIKPCQLTSNPPASFLTILLITATFTILAPPAFIRFALVFPRPKPIVLRYPWIAFLPYAVGLIGIVAFIIEFYVFGFAWTGLSVLLAIVILLHNALTMRDAASRAQLRWGLGGMILGLGLFFSTYIVFFVDLSGPLAATLNAFSTLGFAVMGIGLGIAILRYRLWDIDVIIRRTLVYGGLHRHAGAALLRQCAAAARAVRQAHRGGKLARWRLFRQPTRHRDLHLAHRRPGHAAAPAHPERYRPALFPQEVRCRAGAGSFFQVGEQ